MDKFTEAAHENVERYLADMCLEVMEDSEIFYEEVYTLAHDGAIAAGAAPSQASIIAAYMRTQY
jgi:hypothetical protein